MARKDSLGGLQREFSGLLDDDNDIEFSELVLSEQIGKGSFGRVWRGKYLNFNIYMTLDIYNTLLKNPII